MIRQKVLFFVPTSLRRKAIGRGFSAHREAQESILSQKYEVIRILYHRPQITVNLLKTKTFTCVRTKTCFCEFEPFLKIAERNKQTKMKNCPDFKKKKEVATEDKRNFSARMYCIWRFASGLRKVPPPVGGGKGWKTGWRKWTSAFRNNTNCWILTLIILITHQKCWQIIRLQYQLTMVTRFTECQV